MSRGNDGIERSTLRLDEDVGRTDLGREQRVGQRKRRVKIRRIAEIRLLPLQPRAGEPARATRAMAVVAAARDEFDRRAETADILGVAEFARAAAGECPQDTAFLRRHPMRGEMALETGAHDRAELARRRCWFAAHGIALEDGAGGVAGRRSSGLGMRPSRPAVTCW